MSRIAAPVVWLCSDAAALVGRAMVIDGGRRCSQLHHCMIDGPLSGVMILKSIQDVADKKVLYLTTIGRRTGLPREIEIWFVVCRDRFYLFAETGEAAAWVKNIRENPAVVVRVGERQIGATARVLDRETDRTLWDEVAAIADRKYGWGDGLPVELTPERSA